MWGGDQRAVEKKVKSKKVKVKNGSAECEAELGETD